MLCVGHNEGFSVGHGPHSTGFTWLKTLLGRGQRFLGLSQKTVQQAACALREGQPGWGPWQLRRRARVPGGW